MIGRKIASAATWASVFSKAAIYSGGGKGSGQVEHEPGQAPSQRRRDRRRERLVVDQTDEAVHILGRLLLGDIEQIVRGRDADQVSVAVKHGQRMQSVALQDQQRVFLVHVRGYRRSDRLHQVAQSAHRRREDHRVQTDGAEQNAVGVNDVHRVAHGRRRRRCPEQCQCLLGGEVWSKDHQLRRHDPTGRVIVVLQEWFDEARLGQAVENEFGVALGNRMQDVRAELRRALIEGGRQLGQRHVWRDMLELLVGQKRKQFGQRVRIDAIEQSAALMAVKRSQGVGLIGGMQVVQQRGRRSELAGVHARDDIPDGGRWFGPEVVAPGGSRVLAGPALSHRRIRAGFIRRGKLTPCARSSAERAPGFGPGGRGFDSLRACQTAELPLNLRLQSRRATGRSRSPPCGTLQCI